tara:strand:+ start:757 stop:1263 length:507 start_codon:yes stop_codon:yes gene_type:complete
MPRFATGKDAFGLSDRSGFRYRLRDMRQEWNGLLVGKDEWEPKHPQLEPIRHLPDAEALRNPRPDTRTEPAVANILGINPFLSSGSGSSVISVNEPNHGRSSGDIVRFRKCSAFDGFSVDVLQSDSGYSITVVDANNYTFTVSSETANVGNKTGGGAFATAGPVTLEN